MKIFLCLLSLVLVLSITTNAQDEGAIVKRERIDKDKGIFVGLGPSFTLGKNIGDYSTGFNFEAGFLKRINRVLSIGPSLSYIAFNYDPEITNAEKGAYLGTGDPNDWATKYDLPGLDYNYAYVLNLEGGDISLLSFALNLKLNLIPVMDNSKFSIYGFAKPFVTFSSRKEIKGSDERYTYEIFEDLGSSDPYDDVLYYDQADETWYPDGFTSEWGADSYDALKADTGFTGGIFVGPGIEFVPAKSVSFFAQASFGYTLPISFISTESYEATVESYTDLEFPTIKKGFPSVNIQFGVSFNF